LAILKATENFEQNNLKNLLNDALQDAMQALEKEVKTVSNKEILDQAFKSAIKGIKSGRMTYENDPLLPLVTQRIDEF